MNVGGSIKIQGRDALRWIKEDEETKAVDLVFYDNDFAELIFSLDPAGFQTLANMIQKYQAGEKAKNQADSDGVFSPHVFFHCDGESLTLNAEFDGSIKDFPALNFESGDSVLSITLNTAQAKKLEENCSKILELLQTVKHLEEETVIEGVTR